MPDRRPRSRHVDPRGLLMLPGVGHVAQIEAPEAVARAVAGMWDAVSDGRWHDLARPDRVREDPT